MVSTRVLIDGIAISHPQPGGYKTYSTNLVKTLAQIETTMEYLLALDRPMRAPAPPGWRVVVVGKPGSLRVVWREQVEVPRLAIREKVDLLHAPAATAALRDSIPLVLTLHDVIEFTDALPPIKDTKRWAMRVYSRFSQKNSTQRAAHILTVSDYSKRRIIQTFGVAPERITVTYQAPSHIYHLADHSLAADIILRKHEVSDYVLGIASAAPRKNTRGLVSAYATLPAVLRRQHPLVLICTHKGVRDQLRRAVTAAGIDSDVTFVDSVTDEELVLLYNAASVFAFPSLEEGFGLPPLEAMACGVPVIVSDSSSLPEVVGDAGVLVPPGDNSELSAALASVLSNPTLADSLRHRGLAQAQRFSWTKAAEQTLEVYRKVLGSASTIA